MPTQFYNKLMYNISILVSGVGIQSHGDSSMGLSYSRDNVLQSGAWWLEIEGLLGIVIKGFRYH